MGTSDATADSFCPCAISSFIGLGGGLPFVALLQARQLTTRRVNDEKAVAALRDQDCVVITSAPVDWD